MVLQNAYIKVEMLIQKQFKHIVFSIKLQQSTKNSQKLVCFRHSCYKEEIYIVNSEIFVIILFFVDCVKRRICDVKHSRLGHDLPILVNGIMISLFREVSFSRSFVKINPRENFRIYSTHIKTYCHLNGRRLFLIRITPMKSTTKTYCKI